MIWLIVGLVLGLAGGYYLGSRWPTLFRRNIDSIEATVNKLLAKAQELKQKGLGK